MSSANFTNLTDHLARARINFATDTFKAALVSSIPTEANLDAWDFRNDITNEVAATGGYTAGGFDVTASVGAVDTTNNRTPVTFSAASPTYTNSTITAVGCIIYKSTGNAAADPIAHYVDFDGTVSSTNGNFTISFSTPLYINR